VLLEDRLAGQVVSCPSCKKPFQMPAANAVANFAFEQDDSAALGPGAAFAGSEPWYYRFLEGYALTTMWIALTVLGLIALGTVVGFIVTLGQGGVGLYIILALVYALAILVLMVLGIVFGVALILLAVDAGRNLREIRRNTMSRR